MIRTIYTSLTESSFYHIHRLSAISYRLFPPAPIDSSCCRLRKVETGQKQASRGTGRCVPGKAKAYGRFRQQVAQSPRRSRSRRDRVNPSGKVGARGGEASRQNTPPHCSQRK